MKTWANLFGAIVAPENLYAAWREARRGKRYKVRAAQFELDAQTNLLRLEHELRTHTYHPGHYQILPIYDPKRRVIAVAPFRDRVVHHAVCRVLMPILSRSFVYDSYACIPGKGTHRAVLRHLAYMRRFAFRCHLDVAAFFPSIHIDILARLLAQKIRDTHTMRLLQRILEHGVGIYENAEVTAFLGLLPRARSDRRGLPVGNLTSQHLANVYLNELDHFIKRTLRVRGYIRYMDDFMLFANERSTLTHAAGCVRQYLENELALRTKSEPQLVSTRLPADFLGHCITRAGISGSKRTLAKVARRARRLRGAAPERLERSARAWNGLFSLQGV